MAGVTVEHALTSKGLYKTAQLASACRELITRGTQIVYVPQHAEGHLLHPDVEAGFVTSTNVQFAFCRYWNKMLPTYLVAAHLRTKLNSEATGFDDLFIVDTVPQELVDEALEKYC